MSKPCDELLELSLDLLRGHPLQPREGLAEETLASVCAAIADAGTFPRALAITARPCPGGWEIVSGHHRVEAARRAGLANVWAFIRQIGDRDAALLLAEANVHTEMTAIEHGRHALMLKERFGVPLVEYARRMGRGPGWIQAATAAVRVLAAHGGLDHAFAELPYTAIAQVARVSDHGDQQAILVELMGHSTPSSVANQLCTAVERGERPAAAVHRLHQARHARDFHLPPPTPEYVGARTEMRGDLAGRAMHTQWDAEAIGGMAYMLEVRTEELERRRPNLADPREARAFFDLVEARVRAEWPAVRDASVSPAAARRAG